VDRDEAGIARQGHDKHVSAATDTDATIEKAVLSMRAIVTTALCVFCMVRPRIYGEDEHASKQ
jgi:hypothetical protein